MPQTRVPPVVRYHRDMHDDADKDALDSDPPDADVLYARYLESCKRLGCRAGAAGSRARLDRGMVGCDRGRPIGPAI